MNRKITLSVDLMRAATRLSDDDAQTDTARRLALSIAHESVGYVLEPWQVEQVQLLRQRLAAGDNAAAFEAAWGRAYDKAVTV